MICCNGANQRVLIRQSKGVLTCRICGTSQPIGTVRLTNLSVRSLDGLSKISDNQGHD